MYVCMYIYIHIYIHIHSFKRFPGNEEPAFHLLSTQWTSKTPRQLMLTSI